jgi:hypothetical protein
MPFVGVVVIGVHLFIFGPLTQIPFFDILIAFESLYNGPAIVPSDLGLCLTTIVIVTQHLTVLLGVNYKSHIVLLACGVKGGRL